MLSFSFKFSSYMYISIYVFFHAIHNVQSSTINSLTYCSITYPLNTFSFNCAQFHKKKNQSYSQKNPPICWNTRHLSEWEGRSPETKLVNANLQELPFARTYCTICEQKLLIACNSSWNTSKYYPKLPYVPKKWVVWAKITIIEIIEIFEHFFKNNR